MASTAARRWRRRPWKRDGGHGCSGVQGSAMYGGIHGGATTAAASRFVTGCLFLLAASSPQKTELVIIAEGDHRR
uniref:Uncharacterized protein n=1 Tax=Leersia perrieri TaxID=77586 RepID=A0A0D9XDZ4_9ORYZ